MMMMMMMITTMLLRPLHLPQQEEAHQKSHRVIEQERENVPPRQRRIPMVIKGNPPKRHPTDKIQLPSPLEGILLALRMGLSL
jgi:hypothetical protein